MKHLRILLLVISLVSAPSASIYGIIEKGTKKENNTQLATAGWCALSLVGFVVGSAGLYYCSEKDDHQNLTKFFAGLCGASLLPAWLAYKSENQARLDQAKDDIFKDFHLFKKKHSKSNKDFHLFKKKHSKSNLVKIFESEGPMKPMALSEE